MNFPVSLETLGLFCLVELAFSASPGAVVMLVVARAMHGGMRPAMSAAAGALLGNLGFFAASATAVGALIFSLREWFFIVQWLGAAYLLFLAGCLFFAKPKKISANGGAGGRGVFAQGIAVQLANPKTLLFFIAFLPLFVDAEKPPGAQLAVLAAASVAVEFAVLFAYAFVARESAKIMGERFRVLLPRFAALLLAAAAASLLLLKSG